MEEPLRLPTGDQTWSPGEAVGILLESHFPGAGISRLEKSPNTVKTGANNVD